MPPAMFFFKNDLAICELLWFYINYLSVNKSHWNYDTDCIKSIDHSDSIYLNILNLPIHEHSIFFSICFCLF